MVDILTYDQQWDFIHEAYGKIVMEGGDRLQNINDAYWRLTKKGGQLHILYQVMKDDGWDFGKDDPYPISVTATTDAGAEQYDEIMRIQDIQY
jgi:hypothetical protein